MLIKPTILAIIISTTLAGPTFAKMTCTGETKDAMLSILRKLDDIDRISQKDVRDVIKRASANFADPKKPTLAEECAAYRAVYGGLGLRKTFSEIFEQ